MIYSLFLAAVLISLFPITLGQDCPQGTFISAGTCKDCLPGTYNPLPNQTACNKCEAGTFSAFPGAEGESLCRRCPSGTFSKEGASVCKKCPPNTVSEEWSPKCLRCGPGKEVQFRNCGKCAKGSYSSAIANLDCTDCPPGFTTKRKGAKRASDCTKIPPPRCVIMNKPSCGNCDQGSFFNAELQCEPCPPGTFSKRRGARSCTLCPPGTFAAFSFSDRCAPCPAGSSSTVAGSRICKINGAPCPSNHFEDNNGVCQTCDRSSRYDVPSKSCKPCPEGTFTTGGIDTTCKSCPSGFEYVPSLQDCLCEPGRFLTPSGTCQLCPMGTRRTSNSEGPLCARCSRGTFSNKLGAVECTPCPEGMFQDEEGQNQCKPCPPGSRPEPLFSRFCVSTRTDCQPGFTRVNRGGSFFRCEQSPCPPGTYFKPDGPNGPECTKCFPGQRFITSSKQCVQCGPQEVSNGGLQTTCTRCPNNFFRYGPEGDNCRCIESGFGLQNGKCEECPAGTFGLYYKSTCTKCPKGTFANGLGTIIQCRTCPKNTFADVEGLVSCKPCPPGTVAYGLGETSCVPVSR